MSAHQIVYLVFGIVLTIALAFDLGLLSKKNKSISIRQALNQTMFWVGSPAPPTTSATCAWAT